MTLQTAEDLHDRGDRLHPDVRKRIEARSADDTGLEPCVEYEIPAETNGWVYHGDMGAASTTHMWCDAPTVEAATQAVVLHYTPTHPRSETPDMLTLSYREDMSEKHEDEELWSTEGEPYRTPLYTRRLMFWKGVDQAIAWMDNHPPDVL